MLYFLHWRMVQVYVPWSFVPFSFHCRLMWGHKWRPNGSCHRGVATRWIRNIKKTARSWLNLHDSVSTFIESWQWKFARSKTILTKTSHHVPKRYSGRRAAFAWIEMVKRQLLSCYLQLELFLRHCSIPLSSCQYLLAFPEDAVISQKHFYAIWSHRFSFRGHSVKTVTFSRRHYFSLSLYKFLRLMKLFWSKVLQWERKSTVPLVLEGSLYRKSAFQRLVIWSQHHCG